jgi:predicted metal-dependent peptidase
MSTNWSGKVGNLVVARAYVKQYAPYFSPTLYGFIPTPYPGLLEEVGGPIAVTERLVLLYEPAWVENEEMIVLATGLAHECLHDLLRHIARGKQYPNPKRFNKAADLFINGTMETQTKKVKTPSGGQETQPLWKIPLWAALPSRYGFPTGLTADEYYRLLEEKESKEGKDGSGKGQGKRTIFIIGNGPGKNETKTDDENEAPGSSPGKGKGQGKDSHFMSGCCGGIAGNKLSQSLEQAKNQEKGRSEADCKNISRDTAKAIQQHMQSAKGRGDIPGNWGELVDISEKVFRVPWRQKLSNITRYSISRARSGGLDYSRKRPSKRSYLRGVYLPSLIAYDPDIMILVDTSGSMSTHQLMDAKKVISDVLQQTGIQRVWFLDADTQARRAPILISTHELRALTFLGRGGTDFVRPLHTAEKHIPRPSIVIYLTDGDGGAPAEAPRGINVIWCIVPRSHRQQPPASWGTCIFLDDEIGVANDTYDDEGDLDAFVSR